MDEEEFALAYLEEQYKPVLNRKDARVPAEWFSFERFNDMLLYLDNSSSPGYPYLREAPTIGKWLKSDEHGTYDPLQVQRLWYDVQRVVSGEYEHFFRAFVKDEPHKKAKAEQKRWRLIIASSLPVQMVWRMLYHEQNAALNKYYKDIPSKHGSTFCYGGWMDFVATARTKGLKISRDISGWDVGAPGWVFKVVGMFRERWPGVSDSWIWAHRKMYADAYGDSKIIFSNGIVVQQLFPGYMKSGLFSTITDNSLSMVTMHAVACLRSRTRLGSFIATGDDVVQSIISDPYLDELHGLGCRVKEVLHHLEFMGLNFSSGKPEPMYVVKHLVGVCMKGEVLAEVLDAYCRLYAESELFDFWAGLAEDLGVPVRTRWYYKFWLSSPLAALRWNLN
uniref:RNA-dependent RNA polymerase n=1 Tax=Berrek virus TaxID=2651928 RepID=A0A5Q0TW31_9LUTE|nr:RNA-dependent RNA polymerase [Berrek virus]